MELLQHYLSNKQQQQQSSSTGLPLQQQSSPDPYHQQHSSDLHVPRGRTSQRPSRHTSPTLCSRTVHSSSPDSCHSADRPTDPSLHASSSRAPLAQSLADQNTAGQAGSDVQITGHASSNAPALLGLVPAAVVDVATDVSAAGVVCDAAASTAASVAVDSATKAAMSVISNAPATAVVAPTAEALSALTHTLSAHSNTAPQPAKQKTSTSNTSSITAAQQSNQPAGSSPVAPVSTVATSSSEPTAALGVSTVSPSGVMLPLLLVGPSSSSSVCERLSVESSGQVRVGLNSLELLSSRPQSQDKSQHERSQGSVSSVEAPSRPHSQEEQAAQVRRQEQGGVIQEEQQEQLQQQPSTSQQQPRSSSNNNNQNSSSTPAPAQPVLLITPPSAFAIAASQPKLPASPTALPARTESLATGRSSSTQVPGMAALASSSQAEGHRGNQQVCMGCGVRVVWSRAT